MQGQTHHFTPIIKSNTVKAKCSCGWTGVKCRDDIRHGNIGAYERAYRGWMAHVRRVS